SWDLGITPAASDFASTSDPSVSMTGMAIEGMGALGPRQADGSLPDVDFLKLAAASRLIDKGTDVGLAYAGSAPDLGAYEYGAAGTGGTGGTAAGGRPGTGGTAAGGRPGTGGDSGTGGSLTSSGGTPGTGTGTAGSPGPAATGTSSGCSCTVDRG